MTTYRYSNDQFEIEIGLHCGPDGKVDEVHAIKIFDTRTGLLATPLPITMKEWESIFRLQETARSDWRGKEWPENIDREHVIFSNASDHLCVHCHRPMVFTSAGWWCKHGHGYLGNANEQQPSPPCSELVSKLSKLLADHNSELAHSTITLRADGSWLIAVETKKPWRP